MFDIYSKLRRMNDNVYNCFWVSNNMHKKFNFSGFGREKSCLEKYGFGRGTKEATFTGFERKKKEKNVSFLSKFKN